MARKNTDIMAPDGYLLGGERLVRKGGVILFQRGWWQLPEGFAQDGEYCWVHDAGPASDLSCTPRLQQLFQSPNGPENDLCASD